MFRNEIKVFLFILILKKVVGCVDDDEDDIPRSDVILVVQSAPNTANHQQSRFKIVEVIKNKSITISTNQIVTIVNISSRRPCHDITPDSIYTVLLNHTMSRDFAHQNFSLFQSKLLRYNDKRKQIQTKNNEMIFPKFQIHQIHRKKRSTKVTKKSSSKKTNYFNKSASKNSPFIKTPGKIFPTFSSKKSSKIVSVDKKNKEKFIFVFPPQKPSLKNSKFPTQKYNSKKNLLFYIRRPSGKILDYLRKKTLRTKKTLPTKIVRFTLPTRRSTIVKSQRVADEFVHKSNKIVKKGFKGRVVGCPTLKGLFYFTHLFNGGFLGTVYVPPVQTSIKNGFLLQLNFNLLLKNISAVGMREVGCGSNPMQHCLTPTDMQSNIPRYHDLKLTVSGNFSGQRGYFRGKVKLMGICRGPRFRDFTQKSIFRKATVTEESSSSGESPAAPAEPTPAIGDQKLTTPLLRCSPSAPNGVPSSGGNLKPSWNSTGAIEGKIDYNEILHKSILFYEAQRSGKLPPENRISWRGDADLKDGCPISVDLTGGWYNSGGNVKTTSLIAFTTTLLAWGAIDYYEAYQEAGELDQMLDQIRWATDYLLKCQISPSTLIVQIGRYKSAVLSWTRPSSSPEKTRPIQRAHFIKPAADVAGELAASLAAASILFNQSDAEYAEKCRSAATEIYNFGIKHPGNYKFHARDSAFWYNYNHDYHDEMTWGAIWLYRATGKEHYLNISKEGFNKMNHVSKYFSMRQKYQAAAILLAKLTNEETFLQLTNSYLDWYIKSIMGGLRRRFLRPVNTNMYTANAAFLALQAAEVNGTSPVMNRTRTVVENQMEKLVGVSGQGYVVGVGRKNPKRAYHRGSSCPQYPFYCSRNIFRGNHPNPHILYGALVSGSRHRKYIDISGNFFQNNVRIDYNAGFQGVAAAMITTKCTD